VDEHQVFLVAVGGVRCWGSFLLLLLHFDLVGMVAW
jgi:hypothetical protein